MANAVANAIDWYINKLNTMHLVPANAATLLRDISSKQISDGNFTPRPITEDNFTDAELDAIYRLSTDPNTGKHGPISHGSYNKVIGKVNSDAGSYVDEKKGFGSHLSPIGVVSTTLGRAGIDGSKEDPVLNDVYDFNKTRIETMKNEYGNLVTPYGTFKDENDFIQDFNKDYPGKDRTYTKIRNNMSELGHTDSDPAHQKIVARIKINRIKDRLGSRLGTYDVSAPMSKKDFIWKSIGAGALTGAPVGAIAGALASAILMSSKKLRKKWYVHGVVPPLVGSLIGAALGGTGSGFAANKAWNVMDKSAEGNNVAKNNAINNNIESRAEKRSRRLEENKRQNRIAQFVMSLAYSVPALAALGISGYAGYKSKGLIEKLTRTADYRRILEFVNVA